MFVSPRTPRARGGCCPEPRRPGCPGAPGPGSSRRTSCRGSRSRRDGPRATRRPPRPSGLPGARVSLAVIAPPASFDSLTASGDSLCRRSFLRRRCRRVNARVVRGANLRRELPVVLARILASAGGDQGPRRASSWPRGWPRCRRRRRDPARRDEILLVRRRRLDGRRERHALDVGSVRSRSFARSWIHCVRSVSAGPSWGGT